MKQFDPSVLDFDNPSRLFRLEDRLKALLGGPLLYDPYFSSQGGFQGHERVLDFGCGGGVTTRCIASRLTDGGKVTGVDVSSYFTDKARKRTKDFPNAEIYHGDIRELKLAETSFDLIAIVHVIHDIAGEKRPPTVQALARLIKPGGRLWIYEPTRQSHGMPVAEIRRLMKEAGLREVSARTGKNWFKGIFEK